MTILGATGLINFLASLSLAIFVIVQNPKNIRNRTYFLLNFAVALYSFGYFIWQLTDNEISAMFWFKTLFIGIVLINPAYLHFTFAILDKIKIYTYQRILAILYLINIGFIILNVFSFLYPTLEPRFGLGYWPNPTILFHIYLTFWFLQCFYGFYHLIDGYIHSTGIKNQQIKYFMLAAAIGFLGGATNWLVWYKINLPPYLNILITLYIAITAYAIVRHRLMDIEFVIKRSFVYSVLVALIVGVYSLIIFISQEFFGSIIGMRWLLAILGSGLIAIGFKPLEIAFTNFTDKYFFRKKYEYYRALEEVSTKITEGTSTKEILTTLYSAFFDIIKASSPKIFLPESFFVKDGKSDHFLLWDKNTLRPLPEIIEPGNPIYETVKNSKGMILKEKVIVNKDLMREFEEKKIELAIPGIFRGRLIALILLGPKLSEEAYSEEDLRLLKDMANHAAIALANTRTYEEIREDLIGEQEKVARVERQLERSQRLAQLGTLAAGVAHEIRNPMAILRSKAEMIPDKLDDRDFLIDYSGSVVRNIDRVLSITKDMLDLTKTKERENEKLDINALLQNCLNFFTFKKTRIITNFTSEAHVMGDKDRISQVFINIIQNAVDAMPGGGIISVSTSKTTLGNKTYVKTEISDTGCGIGEKDIEKIFDPFYTTKYEEAGLGLSIAHRIVEEHDGTIEVRSKLGEGTTMTILFPTEAA